MRYLKLGTSASCLALVAAGMALDFCQPVHAAKAEGLTIEEITVTARRRKERLQDTPIAITALTSSDLEERSLGSLADLGNIAPNLTMATGQGGGGGGNNIQIYIRGVGQTDFLFTTDPGVGIYIDGVYHPRALGGVLDLADIARVEVLRGPQGTLFGKNTIGGAISVTTVKPTNETKGYVEATIGKFHRLDARGSFNVPVVKDKLFASVAISSKNRDGYGKRLEYGTNKVLDTTGDQNQVGARIALRWLASDNVTVDLTADYTREREKSVPTTLVQFDPNAPLAGLWNAFVHSPYPMSSAFITGDPYTTYGTGPNGNTLNAYGTGLTIDWKISDTLGLKSISAYRQMDATFGRDGDGSPNAYVHTNEHQKQHQTSEELQLAGTNDDGRLKWVVGGFYFNEYGFDHNDVQLASGLYNALEALPGTLDGSPLAAPTAPGGAGNPINKLLDLDFNINNWIRIKSYAGFGQASFDVTSKLSLTAGARYSYEKKIYSLHHIRVNAGVDIIPLTTIEKHWGSFTPMATIDYKWTSDFLTYASFSRGFKSGGFNGRPTTAAEVASFNPEYLTAYEVGVKSDWLGRRLRLNMAAFYNDYKDIQLGSVGADSTGNLILLVQNAGKARVQGFEAELTAKPAQGLDISGSMGYTDFKFKSLNPGVVDITLNTVQPKTPKWNASASIQYTFPVGNAGTLSLRGDWTFSSKVYQDVLNTESIAQPALSLFNARMTFAAAQGGWELAVFGTNLTDKRYLVNGLSDITSFGAVEGFYGRPREWGASVKKRF